jgi:Ca2+-binding RTX toxin-like protein
VSHKILSRKWESPLNGPRAGRSMTGLRREDSAEASKSLDWVPLVGDFIAGLSLRGRIFSLDFAGDDDLTGGDGAGTLSGRACNDTLRGNAEDNTLDGGAGPLDTLDVQVTCARPRKGRGLPC